MTTAATAINQRLVVISGMAANLGVEDIQVQTSDIAKVIVEPASRPQSLQSGHRTGDGANRRCRLNRSVAKATAAASCTPRIRPLRRS